jgi:hypothetical protein
MDAASQSTGGQSISENDAPLRNLDRHSQIEIDVFCTHCFYNLHGQVVRIDPRLGFPICQCPECGRFHPAGTGVSASSLWLRRFASFLLMSWIALVGVGTVALAVICFAFSTASVESFTNFESYHVNNKWLYRMTLRDWRHPSTPETSGLSTMMYISAGSLITGIVIGMLCVTLLWHWKKPRYLWAMLLPMLSMGVLAMIYNAQPTYDLIFKSCIRHVASQTGIQAIGVVIGILIGRHVSRTIVRMVIPPKPRQALAFLWLVDGKAPPK